MTNIKDDARRSQGSHERRDGRAEMPVVDVVEVMIDEV